MNKSLYEGSIPCVAKEAKPTHSLEAHSFLDTRVSLNSNRMLNDRGSHNSHLSRFPISLHIHPPSLILLTFLLEIWRIGSQFMVLQEVHQQKKRKHGTQDRENDEEIVRYLEDGKVRALQIFAHMGEESDQLVLVLIRARFPVGIALSLIPEKRFQSGATSLHCGLRSLNHAVVQDLAPLPLGYGGSPPRTRHQAYWGAPCGLRCGFLSSEKRRCEY